MSSTLAGVSSAEAALGHDNIGLAPLIDQLALLQFFQDRMKGKLFSGHH